VVSIVAFQAVDPGSIPGCRNFGSVVDKFQIKHHNRSSNWCLIIIIIIIIILFKRFIMNDSPLRRGIRRGIRNLLLFLRTEDVDVDVHDSSSTVSVIRISDDRGGQPSTRAALAPGDVSATATFGKRGERMCTLSLRRPLG
jgi:hypothetical protein